MLQLYQAQQLIPILEDLQRRHANGTLYLEAKIDSLRKKSLVLTLKDGQITYGGLKIPNNQEFAKMLGKKFKRDWIDAAIALATKKATTQTSVRELLELLVRMRMFTWEQIESLVYTQIVLTLEQVLSHPGQFQFDSKTQFDLCHGEACYGLSLSRLMLDVTRRQEQWSEFVSFIPSMVAVPHLQANALQEIGDLSVRQHLQQWVDGKRSLLDIAEGLEQDPMDLAQSYLCWVEAGWIAFNSIKPTQPSELPTILAVDDSLVIQIMLKRVLTEHYQVVVASNAKDALILLNRHKVSLLLLDVSMPEIDGLELCRTIRSMPHFRKLPIVMLTGQDGLVNKMKGQIAGSTEYLTKPFEPENLRRVVGKYVTGSNGT